MQDNKNELQEKKPKVKKNNHYINKDELLLELERSHEKGRMTERLGEIFLLLSQRCLRIANSKTRLNFVKYTYHDDMQGFGLLTLCSTWHKFDPKKYEHPEPFSYFTAVVTNAYKGVLSYEKKHRMIRDELRMESGLNPSENYKSNGDDMGDFDQMEIYDHQPVITNIDIVEDIPSESDDTSAN